MIRAFCSYSAKQSTERGSLYDMKIGRVFVQEDALGLLATYRLSTRKPWAIDTSYFTAVKRPLYLQSMAVRVDSQRRGIGRDVLAHAVQVARDWPADAIRLDAYDTDGGAGPFYAKCGFREVGRVTYRGTPLIYFELMLDSQRRSQRIENG